MASRSGMMPPVAVYFVKFCSMARMAAFLMCSGVGKSGSPGPKSAISTPFAFSFSASAMTAAVGEIWMRLMRSVSCTRSPLVVSASTSLAGVVNQQAVEDFDFDAGPLPGDFAQHLHTLSHRKQGRFFRVTQYRHNHQIKHLFAA